MKKNTHAGNNFLKYPDFFRIFRTVGFTFLLLPLTILTLQANSRELQEKAVQLSKNTLSVEELMEEIEKQTGYLFIYNESDLNINQQIKLDKTNRPLDTILKETFGSKGLSYAIEDGYISLYKREAGLNQADVPVKTISGTVVDEFGDPVIGANVIIKGTTTGAVTGLDGEFSFDAPINALLQVSYVGYNAQEIQLKGESIIRIQLQENMQSLDEVVVIGYGVQKRASLSGSIATVSQDDIKKSASSNLSDALVGRMPGLIAVNQSGTPGSGSKLLIRGQGTWNNSDPLVIVDGVERDFSHLDPNEVETITILKDASAAAVYGARAANGVILVTTRRGKDGKPTVTLDTYYGIKSLTRFPELAQAYDWATTRNMAYLLDGVDPNDTRIFTQEQLERFRTGEQGTDWYKETFNKSAPQYYANVGLSGGSEKVKYYVALGHHNEDGIVDNYTYKKFNLRSNIDAQVSERLSISVDIDASTRRYHTPGWDVTDMFGYVARQNPTLTDYHPNGLPANTTGEHLVEMVHNSGYDKQYTNDFRSTFRADYKIPGIEGLLAKGMFSYGKTYQFNKRFFIPYTMYDVNENGDITNTKVVGEKTTLNEEFAQNYGYIYNLSLNYNRTFGKHDVGVLLLYEQEESKKNNFSAYRTNYVSNQVPQLSAGGDADKTNAGKASEWARNGMVGRINYGYDGTYMVEASFRYDGSLTFPKGKRYGFFPSASAAWRLSNESFIRDNVSFIDNLKLRVSYGVLGNDQVNLWQYMSEFVFSSAATIGGQNVNSIAVYEDLFPNPDITWEKSATFNVGIDGLFWNGLLGFEIDYFKKRTRDILAAQIRTIPETFGAKLPDVNYGILDNQGIEIMVNHRNKVGDFTYQLGGNFSFARNKVIRYDESETTPEYYRVVGKSFTYTITDENSAEKGRPYAGLVGMKALGIFQSEEEIANSPKQFNGGQKPGDVKYEDLNKDGVVDENDLMIVNRYGNIPEIIYGFNLGFGWKGLELSALFQGAAHKSIMLTSYGTTMFLDGTSNYYKYLADDAWTPDNRNAKYPRPYVGGNTNNNRASTIWVKSGDYLRLKNIELSYTLPRTVLDKCKGIHALRFYINGTNLLTFDKLGVMDPESASGSAQYYPQTKSVNFGFNITY